jgi:hypothetical protein
MPDEDHRRMMLRMLERHDPFKTVWRGRPAPSTGSRYKRVFHDKPECRGLRYFEHVRSGRLGVLLASHWLPCYRCFPEAFEPKGGA